MSAKLALPTKPVDIKITGLGKSKVGKANKSINIVIKPHTRKFPEIDMTALLVPQISSKLPAKEMNPTKWTHLQSIEFADPKFYIPADVDLLIGAELFFVLLEGEKRIGKPQQPIGLNSKLGWLVGGGTENWKVNECVSNHVQSEASELTDLEREAEVLDKLLRQFWELEDLPEIQPLSMEEQACEEDFVRTVTRDATGRYHVKYPFKKEAEKLGESLMIAIRRFYQIERRLQSNEKYYNEYKKFMQDYEDLDHMIEVNPPEEPSSFRNYIPHHFVLKDEEKTEKFRVVFDASARTSNGVSLNQTMMIGKIPQGTLWDLVIRFRTHKIAITADITKMYRQIRVSDEDAQYQHIVWRKSPDEPLKHYKLLTITYGTASAPALATRTLQDISEKMEESLPVAAKVIKDDFYMDDLMSGAEDEDAAIQLIKDVRETLLSAQLPLRKFSSNSKAVLKSLPEDLLESPALLSVGTTTTVKALGIYWNPSTDKFGFKINQNVLNVPEDNMTKRKIASGIAKLFDPIGWISPIIVKAKIMLQSLWKLKIEWDDQVPEEVVNYWKQFKDDLPRIEILEIPRFYMHESEMTLKPGANKQIYLIGFGDASELSYAACVYLCVYEVDSKTAYKISLVSSKTKVAPIKEITIPRLELLAAELLARLIQSVKNALKIEINGIYCFSDSKDTLAWINKDPSNWKKFVANRVAKIQRRVAPKFWNHVKGKDNPADIASRGINSTGLKESQLWWQGPDWLKEFKPEPNYVNLETNLEMKKVKSHVAMKNQHAKGEEESEIWDKFLSFNKMQRTVAWMIRFVQYVRLRIRQKKGQTDSVQVEFGSLEPEELIEATKRLIKIHQSIEFELELKSIAVDQAVTSKSEIISLFPFLDEDGVLRVGGRLRHADISYNKRHPILMKGNSPLAKLLIKYEHERHFHCGPQALLSILQRKYWIIRCKDAIKQTLRRCVKCSRMQAKTLEQSMADLPAFRVNPAHPFQRVGMDYAGPFQNRPILKRSKTTIKAYLAIFVCFVTRAIHIEVVTEATTLAFLAALRRFIPRRGKPSEIMPDCGSNFIGAKNEMKEFIKLVQSKPHNETVQNEIAAEGIKWKNNPPASPHFGGLWEAGVKSTKYHLYRIMGNHRLTFEEMYTITTQIEAILNSRPLTPESTDPSDLRALTPGHFLIGRPLTTFPEPDLTDIKENRLVRWQVIQQLTQQFWKRWSNEYLTRLQQRPKWLKSKDELKVGSLVLIKDELQPPLKWKMARILELLPGKDGLVRTVKVKTANGELIRPIVKICMLPIETSQTENQDVEEEKLEAHSSPKIE